jgi:hypothetical protein
VRAAPLLVRRGTTLIRLSPPPLQKRTFTFVPRTLHTLHNVCIASGADVYLRFIQDGVCCKISESLGPNALLMVPSPGNGAPEDRPRRPRAAFVVGDEWTVTDPESPRAIRLN